MREDFKEKVKAYIRRGVKEYSFLRELVVMEMMENFSNYLDRTKGAGWSLADITQVDVVAYCQEQYQKGDQHAERYYIEFSRFLQFAEREGWMSILHDEKP
jgi:hypothetical protein